MKKSIAVHAVLLCIGFGMMQPPTSAAQPSNYLGIGAACDGSTVEINYNINVVDPIDPTVAGFDIWRKRIGLECRASTLVTEEPIPYQLGTQLLGQLVDTVSTPGFAYEYRLVAVDASRDRVNVSDYFGLSQRPSYASCGRALLARGRLRWIGYAYQVSNFTCGTHCLLGGTIQYVPPSYLAPWAEEGVVLDIYGTATFTFEGPQLQPTEFVVSSCDPVGTDSISWGALRARY